jgi:hypothetical protein
VFKKLVIFFTISISLYAQDYQDDVSNIIKLSNRDDLTRISKVYEDFIKYKPAYSEISKVTGAVIANMLLFLPLTISDGMNTGTYVASGFSAFLLPFYLYYKYKAKQQKRRVEENYHEFFRALIRIQKLLKEKPLVSKAKEIEELFYTLVNVRDSYILHEDLNKIVAISIKTINKARIKARIQALKVKKPSCDWSVKVFLEKLKSSFKNPA